MTQAQQKGGRRKRTDSLEALRLDRRGLTLIELMIAMTIAAGLVAGSIGMVETLNRSKLKGEVVKLSGAIKYTHAQSIIKQKYYQLVINLSSGTYHVEMAASDRPGAPPTIPKRGLIGAPEGVDFPGLKVKSAKEDPTLKQGGSGFQQVEDKTLKLKQLENGISFMRVFTPSYEDGVEEGEATLLFFPNGFVEPSIIVIGEEDSGVFSLEVEPMTGKVKVLSGEQRPERDFFEGEED